MTKTTTAVSSWRGARLFLVTISALLGCAPVWATVAGATLGIAHDARSAPMGPGFVALADHSGAMDLNPAGLSRITRSEASAFYSPYLLDSRMTALSIVYPGTALGSLGAGYFSLGSKGFDGRDADGNKTGGFSTEDRVINLSLARPLGEGRSSMGVTVKLFQSRLADAQAQSIAGDIGALHRLESLPLSLGLSLRHIGSGLRYQSRTEQLPLTLTAGAAYQFKGLPTSLVLGASRGLITGRTEFGLGTEIMLGGFFAMRGSYLMTALGKQGGGSHPIAPGIVGGFGIRVANYQIDGSVNPMGELGTVMQFSVTMRFGEERVFERRSERRAQVEERFESFDEDAPKRRRNRTRTSNGATQPAWMIY